MQNIKVFPSKLNGKLTVPSSKSHTMRALFFALLADGTSKIRSYLPSPDTFRMIEAIEAFGAKVKIQEDTLLVTGTNGFLRSPENIIECGNSGQVLRFIGALSALLHTYTIFTGDESIRKLRPIKPLLDGVEMLGGFAKSCNNNDLAPIIIKGPIHGGKIKIDGKDSQPVSAFLMLGSKIQLEIDVENPGETPWIDLTLSWLDRFQIPYIRKDYSYFKTFGNAKIKAFEYKVPVDFSSLCFPIAAAIITGSEIFFENIDHQDVQGDKRFIDELQNMGCVFEKTSSTLNVKKNQSIFGKEIDLNSMIDCLPIFTAIGPYLSSKLELKNAQIARSKESDRIACITKEMKKMGASIFEKEDGLIVMPSKLQGSLNLYSHKDHRIAMSLIIAALNAENPSVISDIECIDKSYPNFITILQKLGAKIEVLN